MSDETGKPTIEPMPNGPFRVKGLDTMKNAKGEDIPTKPVMSLCRCGRSSNKPFCEILTERAAAYCEGCHLRGPKQ